MNSLCEKLWPRVESIVAERCASMTQKEVKEIDTGYESDLPKSCVKDIEFNEEVFENPVKSYLRMEIIRFNKINAASNLAPKKELMKQIREYSVKHILNRDYEYFLSLQRMAEKAIKKDHPKHWDDELD